MGTTLNTLTNERPAQRGRPKRPHAVILAGGKGTRLAPLTTVLPKPLMPLGDGPILDVLLRQLAVQGWREVTLAVGHMASLIRAYCGNGSRYGLKIRYLEEEQPLGTVGPLAFLPESARQRPVLVMNGDLLTNLKFTDLVAAHAASGAAASIAVQQLDVQMEFGVMDLGGSLGDSRRILNYREKPRLDATVSMGVYVFEPNALELIEPGVRLDLPELILRLIERGEDVAGYPFEGYWLDIGRHSDYQKALEDFERMKHALLAPAEVAAVSPVLPLAAPTFDEAEAEAVAEVVRSGWLTMGPRTAEFEEAFAERVGTRHAVMASSCTAALHLAFAALDIGPGDEVIVPSLTFVATANAVAYTGATPRVRRHRRASTGPCSTPTPWPPSSAPAPARSARCTTAAGWATSRRCGPSRTATACRWSRTPPTRRARSATPARPARSATSRASRSSRTRTSSRARAG